MELRSLYFEILCFVKALYLRSRRLSNYRRGVSFQLISSYLSLSLSPYEIYFYFQQISPSFLQQLYRRLPNRQHYKSYHVHLYQFHRVIHTYRTKFQESFSRYQYTRCSHQRLCFDWLYPTCVHQAFQFSILIHLWAEVY